MIACGTEVGDGDLIRGHGEFLNGFAPDFVPSLLRGENPIFHRREHMALLLDGPGKAGLGGE